ncbi:ScyD/ScyE family protein [uncultured Cellulomonas sp.]|uniref:ScyD/ScyE family protein n=1 Tax=uncultured Cellulomonas sp. TaxID=189682 RepID=UPI002604B2B7|nr:ScyD/ScyE family protein [uncultured Cellulomonas sp.]
MPGSTLPRTLRAALTSTVLCGALVATGGAAQARDDHGHGRWPVPTAGTPEVLADGLVGPLSLDVGTHRTVYVSQNFAGTIDAVRKGAVTPVVTSPSPDVELGSVSSQGSRLYYTTSIGAGTPDFDAHLVTRTPRGEEQVLADLGQHERDHNPDGEITYGFVGLADGCEIPEGIPVSYPGALDSHPYATELWHGKVLVADAGGNDILSVDRHGDVSTVAVLPPTPLEVTADVAGGLGLPECAVGSTYLLESVPTDVEVGTDGWLYATSLPGGPEGPGLPLGAVYRVHPRSGAVELVARAFSGATNLAVGPKGEIFVTELFGGKVSVIPRGSSTPQTFLEAALPAAVEVDGKSLYVTTEALPGDGAPPSGKILKVALQY